MKDALANQWTVIRGLERDIETAMIHYNRGNDGLGYAAVASMLAEKGWTNQPPAFVRPKLPREKLSEVRAILDRVCRPFGVCVQDLLEEPNCGRAPAHFNQARRAAYAWLHAHDHDYTTIARMFGRDRSTVSIMLNGRKDRKRPS